MALHGKELWGNALQLARRARQELGKVRGLGVVGPEVVGRPGAHGIDETKLVMDVHKLGPNGYLAADCMLEHFQARMELATHRHLLPVIMLADPDDTIDRLIEAVKGLVKGARAKKPDAVVPLPHHRDLGTELVMLPTKAFFGPTHKCR